MATTVVVAVRGAAVVALVAVAVGHVAGATDFP
jgi:hypothetical protein